jgi:hypothetical protein
MISDLQRAEFARQAVLAFLAARNAISFDAAVIRQRVTASRHLDFNPTDEEIAAALAFLRGREWVSVTRSGFGATQFYQATSAGVLAHERGELENTPS